jgi:hypothetical protein
MRSSSINDSGQWAFSASRIPIAILNAHSSHHRHRCGLTCALVPQGDIHLYQKELYLARIRMAWPASTMCPVHFHWLLRRFDTIADIVRHHSACVHQSKSVKKMASAYSRPYQCRLPSTTKHAPSRDSCGDCALRCRITFRKLPRGITSAQPN